MSERKAFQLPAAGPARVEAFGALWWLISTDVVNTLDALLESGQSPGNALVSLDDVYRYWLGESLQDAINFGRDWWVTTRIGHEPRDLAA